MTNGAAKDEAPRFAVFKGTDAQPYAEMTIMQYEPMSAVASEGVQRATDVGWDNGHDMKLIFSTPGFSLIRLWFKSGFPLPRHCHDVDCLYYIVGGSLRIGHEELGVGDGFFIGRDVPYMYTPGPEGVEVLEFRAADAFNISVLADNRIFWDKALDTVHSKLGTWAQEVAPSSSSKSAR